VNIRYNQRPEVSAVAQLALRRTGPDRVQIQQPWIHWRGLFEYLACVEMARENLRALPRNADLEITHGTAAKYHSVALVFMAQALMDNLAVWLTSFLGLPIKGGDRQLFSVQFRRQLNKKAPEASEMLKRHDAYLREVNKYRQIWIHTLSGGAVLWSDTSPFTDPAARKQVAVPIDPSINVLSESYRNRVKKCAERHGRYLYPICEFADRMADGANATVLDVLRFSLEFAKASK